MSEILSVLERNSSSLVEIGNLPVLDAEGKIPSAVLRIVGALAY